MGHDQQPALKLESTRGEMNASLLILRVAFERRDAQNERDGAGLRSSFAAATPSQQRLATPSQLRRASESHLALQPSTQLVVFVASILEVLLAAARGGTRRHLEGGRALRAASAPSQQDQLHHSSRSRRRGDGSVLPPATMSGRRGEKKHQAAPRRIIGQLLDGFATFWTVASPNLLRS